MSDCTVLDTPVVLSTPRIYFSDFFDVSRNTIDEYGAFDISLINDIPLFVDPFLIYKNEKYKSLHLEIVKYLLFLQDNAKPNISDEELEQWFMFNEVKQNWFGFSVDGNNGSGLSYDFAIKLNNTIKKVFEKFGSKENSQTVHIEKFCLFQDKIGKDKISDFTTNIIKDYLLKYTEDFAKENIDPKYCKNYQIKKAYFDYQSKKWISKNYFLPAHPFYPNDMDGYVILSPIDLLTKDDTWICENDITKSHKQYKKVLNHISDTSFSKEVSNFYEKEMLTVSGDRSKYHKMVMHDLINKYPSYLDYYISYKTERIGELEASQLIKKRVFNVKSLFLDNGSYLVSDLVNYDFFNKYVSNIDELREKTLILKNILDKNCQSLFIKDKPITNAKEINMLFNILLKSNNSLDKNIKLKDIFDVKLGTNIYLDKYLYNRKKDGIVNVVMIICYSLKKSASIRDMLNKLNISDENIIIVEAVKTKLK